MRPRFLGSCVLLLTLAASAPAAEPILRNVNIRGGQVIGASDRISSAPFDNPIEPPQILASIYHGMGINLDTTMMPGPGERPVRLVEAEPIKQLFG